LDEVVYEEALDRLSEQAMSIGDNPDILILEFARREYRSAVQALVRKGLKPDLIVYLRVSLETALNRNRHRRDHASGDNHYTSEEELRGYFGSDDIDAGSESFPIELKIIDNENDSAASELIKAREVISKLLS
jgi:thymidylate kinase